MTSNILAVLAFAACATSYVSVVVFFHFYQINLVCIDVAICDLVHDVEAIFCHRC